MRAAEDQAEAAAQDAYEARRAMRAADARASSAEARRSRRSGSRAAARAELTEGPTHRRGVGRDPRRPRPRAAEAERRSRELASLVCGEQRRLISRSPSWRRCARAARRAPPVLAEALKALGAARASGDRTGPRRGARASSPPRPCAGGTGSGRPARADPADTTGNADGDGQHPHRGPDRPAGPRRDVDRRADAACSGSAARPSCSARWCRRPPRPPTAIERRPRRLRDRRRRPAECTRCHARVPPARSPARSWSRSPTPSGSASAAATRAPRSRWPPRSPRCRRRGYGDPRRDISAGGVPDGAHQRRWRAGRVAPARCSTAARRAADRDAGRGRAPLQRDLSMRSPASARPMWPCSHRSPSPTTGLRGRPSRRRGVAVALAAARLDQPVKRVALELAAERAPGGMPPGDTWPSVSRTRAMIRNPLGLLLDLYERRGPVFTCGSCTPTTSSCSARRPTTS